MLARASGAAAFPLLDATNPDQVPQGTELATPDAQDLLHQLRLANGLAAPAGGGWTFVPRIDVQEELTDNVLQIHSPRQADVVTFVAPGIGLAGDLPRLQMTLDFAPTLAIYARTSSLNALTEQLNGLASVTLVPDLAYVDVRAVSGVQNRLGGVGGLGTLGQSTNLGSPLGTVPDLAGNGLGLNKNNEVQTSSFGISPYLLHRFGDWGNGKLGYSLNATRSDTLSGFAAPPFPTGGTNGQTQITQEEIAHFDTGDFLGSFQNGFDVDLSQGQNTTDAGFPQFNGTAAGQTTHTNSHRASVSDRITYQVNRSIAVFASGGHEDVSYSSIGFSQIHDLTWSLGTTLTPNPDTAVTVSYGHLNGITSLSLDGHYALTARTALTASYGNTLGTQLETVQNQLNLAAPGGNGGLVNGRTGGTLFGSTNALPVANGVYRTATLVLGSQTTLDRDIVALNLVFAKQTGVGAGNGTETTSKTANLSWVHQMRPDMIVSAALALSWQDQGSGFGANPGKSVAELASLAWRYQISDTVSANVRYSFLDRQSAVSAYSLYQNLLILGITKTF